MEHVEGIAAIVIQTIVILFGIGVAWGMLNGTIKNHGSRLNAVEKSVEKMQDVMVIMARYEERYSAMDRRMLAEGVRLDQTSQSVNARIDSSISIINGRLDAINNIVSGHTAQLNSIAPRIKPVA